MIKKILGLFIIGIGIINIAQAGSYTYTGSVSDQGGNWSANAQKTLFGIYIPLSEYDNNESMSVNCVVNNILTDGPISGIIFQNFKNVNQYAGSSGVYLTKQSDTEYTYSTNSTGLGFFAGFNFKFSTSGIYNISFDYSCTFEGDNILSQLGCPTCEEQYTSLECQTEYGLIPIENITANYCKLNFNLIEPNECPSCNGTGSTQRTARYLNNTQYPGTSTLYINTEDYLEYDIDYSQDETTLDIGINADTQYIENVINKTKYAPNNNDVEYLFTNGITNYLPWFFVCALFLITIPLLKRAFK